MIRAPWVLLHGFTGSARSWGAVMGMLEAGTPAHALPLSGHSPETIDLPVADFEAEVDRLAGAMARLSPRVRLCGYSLGGRLALGTLVRHPELVCEAVLIGAHPGLETDSERRARAESDARLVELLEVQGIEAFVDYWEALPLFATQSRLPADRLASQRAERRAHDPRGLAQSLRATGLAQMPSYWPALPSIRLPVTLVTGSLDDKFTALARRMQRLLPTARSVVVPDSGHNVVLEHPEQIARLLALPPTAPVTAGAE